MVFIVQVITGTIQPDSRYPLLITGIVCTFYNVFIVLQLFVANKTGYLLSFIYTTKQNNHEYYGIHTVL